MPVLYFIRDIDSDAVQILYIVILLQEHHNYGDCVRLGRNEITRVRCESALGEGGSRHSSDMIVLLRKQELPYTAFHFIPFFLSKIELDLYRLFEFIISSRFVPSGVG